MHPRTLVKLLAVAMGLGALGHAAAADAAPAKRAKPPQWTADVVDAFFPDAREALVGTRPERPASVESTPGDRASFDGLGPGGGEASAGGRVLWSQLIDGESLAAEVKRLTAELREPLANPSRFKAGGYQQCRAAFNLLAILFAAIAEYDGDVRWQADAAALRDSLARAGLNCKVGTDQTFSEASQRRAELEDLVRGQPLGLQAAEPAEDWSALADRSLLMQYLEESLEERLKPALANPRDLSRRAAEIRQNAQVLALLGAAIERENFDYWDDEPFQQQAAELRAAAGELSRAVDQANAEAARAALERLEQSCVNCHAGYRG